jgi:uncharacterized protein DUF4440
MSSDYDPAVGDEGVLAAERALQAAQFAGDVDALDRLLHPDLLAVGPDGGLADKAADLAAHRAGAFVIDELEEEELRMVSDQRTAVTFVLVRLRGSIGNDGITGLVRYTLWDLARTARLVWTSLLELTGLVPDDELENGVLAAGTQTVLATPRLAAAIDDLLASPDRREHPHRLISRLHLQRREVLGRWADVMVNSGTYAEIVDRHVELYSLLYWSGSVLDESDPLEEHLDRSRLSRISLATRASIGPVEGEWLRDNLVAIAKRAESLDRASCELAMRIVPIDWWTAQLPNRPSTAQSPPT